MDDEVEIVSDAEGLAVIGEASAVDRFLRSFRIRDVAQSLGLDRLSVAVERGGTLANAGAVMSEKSGRYVKLTKESADLIREHGLMPTKTEGISHAMVGAPGNISKWVQIENSAGAVLTNPAVLAGAAGILAQEARKAETRELKEMLERIDGKLDDVRRRQRDEVLARLDRAIESIDQATTISELGGDANTAWGKVVAEAGTISGVRGDAIRALEALADKIENPKRVGEVAKAMTEIEQEAALWLAVLGRTFQAENDFTVLELDQVMRSAPEKLEAHRQALAKTLARRQRHVVEKSTMLIERMASASNFAGENVVLHANAARKILRTANSVGATIVEFHQPLGLELPAGNNAHARWAEAIRDGQQLKNAAREAGPKVGAAMLAASLLVITVLVQKHLPEDLSSSD